MATYTDLYGEGSQSRSMAELMAERGEDPVFWGTDDDSNELFRFPDGTEVIVTNSGLVVEGEDGFEEVKADITGE